MTEEAADNAEWSGQNLSAPLLALSVGITGHRPNRLPEDLGPILRKLEQVFARLRTELAQLPERAAFSAEPAHLRLVSSLATGTDVAAAQVALDAGYELDVCIPFAQAEYRRDFPGEADQATFDRLLARADSVVALAGDRAAEHAAYESTGHTMLALSDLLIAVWNGEVAAGPGGTAEIVARAVDSNVPVIHIPIVPDGRVEIVWAGLSDLPRAGPTMWTAPRLDFETAIGELVSDLVAPPDDAALPKIAEALERPPMRWSPIQFAWPLLLFLFRARTVKVQKRRETTAAGSATDFGDEDFERRLARHVAPLYQSADSLAQVYGLKHRSGFVLNFALAAFAVLFSAMGIVASRNYPRIVPLLGLAEVGAILGILLFTWRASRAAWHAKWLFMRHLAEWMRLLDFALRLGNPLTRFDEDADMDWVRWRARAAARAVGVPSHASDTGSLATMRTRLLSVIGGQFDYHTRNAARMRRMNHRTHMAGVALVLLSLSAAAVHTAHTWQLLFGAATHASDGSSLFSGAVTLLSIAAPAMGSAIYGIRMLGDFDTLAVGSGRIAEQLAKLEQTVEADPLDHGLLSDRVGQLAAIMLRDTVDWRRNFEGRPLGLG